MAWRRNTPAADSWLRLAAWGWPVLWWLILLITSFVTMHLGWFLPPRHGVLDYAGLSIPVFAVLAVLALKWAGVPFRWQSVRLFALLVAFWLCAVLAAFAVVVVRLSADA